MMVQDEVIVQALLKAVRVLQGQGFKRLIPGVQIGHPEHAGPEAVGPVVVFLDPVLAAGGAGRREIRAVPLHVPLKYTADAVQLLRHPCKLLFSHKRSSLSVFS